MGYSALVLVIDGKETMLLAEVAVTLIDLWCLRINVVRSVSGGLGKS